VAALSPVARPKELSSVWLLAVRYLLVLTALLNAARPSSRTTKMRPSRGMGAIAPSKVPKLIKKRDGDEPVKVFKQGGKVRKFSEGREVDRKEKIVRNSKNGITTKSRPSGNLGFRLWAKAVKTSLQRVSAVG
jgi:hypothetical protein